MSAVTVAIADDNAVVRMGLRSLLESSDRVELIGEASDGQELVELVERERPDVTLCDIRMPRLNGLGALHRVADLTRFVMLTNNDDEATVREAMQTGARGYLVYGHHDGDEILAAIVSVANGSTVWGPAATQALLSPSAAPSTRDSGHPAAAHLSEREREIMELVAAGKRNAEIASTLFLAEKTVKNHLNRIFPKLGVTTRAEAISLWLSPKSRHESAEVGP
ncbi:DNA-binding response regulator [Aeromicrobium camelliae]|uniref:DNA-binding response regulator n=1 Tax=Aeromicrobium camelliae TaxID=1538144 RepID=A0A3N6WE58_9ACTN|nr:response regulator transcription factor [Aeromicrobium camelliae]RQN03272.1 DNA-binding response regulator [Aeromicrobium camelliae]